MTIKDFDGTSLGRILLGINAALLGIILTLFLTGKSDLRDDIKVLRRDMNDGFARIEKKADEASDNANKANTSIGFIEKRIDNLDEELAKKQ